MASIYEKSFLTLVTTSSASDDEGCFATISADSMPVDFTRAIAKWDHLAGTKLFMKCTLDHNLDSLPLLSRAWVYQERLLPPCVVHSAPNELIWECMSAIRCECGWERMWKMKGRFNRPAKEDHVFAIRLV
ncbi:hypothetical protein K432DRAFT_468023, partial [Lepidopterella palustris CBS 459.81]